MAEELASKGVELGRKERESPKSKKPSYMTDREWKKQAEMGMGADISRSSRAKNFMDFVFIS